MERVDRAKRRALCPDPPTPGSAPAHLTCRATSPGRPHPLEGRVSLPPRAGRLSEEPGAALLQRR